MPPLPRRVAPLFQKRAIEARLAGAVFPDNLAARHEIVREWAKALREGKLDPKKEVSLHGEFLGRIFGDVLGYRQTVGSAVDEWDLDAEAAMGGGKSADAAIGFFRTNSPARVLGPIELKGVKQSLDHAQGRDRTPVDQAWNYANHSPGSRWIIVSNYGETRLYSTARTPDFFEVFTLEELDELACFKRFYLLFARENLLPTTPEGRSRTDELLRASEAVEKDITEKLYGEYKELRRKLYAELGRVHSNIPAVELIGFTQTILDRVLFVAFAEDRGLLPKHTIKDTADHRDRFSPKPVWENFKGIFRWIDRGNAENDFPAYNGGLFAERPEIDSLELSDEICREFKKIAAYDFHDEVSVDVLGHIFEQSISDLEEMRAAAADGNSVGEQEKASKRHDEGIYYTPAYVTRFIVDKTIGRTLGDEFQRIVDTRRPDDKKKDKDRDQAWIGVWEEYREAIKAFRVLDPACGSGAFLAAAFDALAREYDRVNAALAGLRQGQVGLFDLTKTVLNNNLFGVDLNSESVEITKLSLWLKTAQRGRALTYLDSNIKWGNSIVSDANLDYRAFEWRTGSHARAFLEPATAPEAAEIDARWQDKFDAVIGNPPYIRHERLTAIKPHLELTYGAYHGMADIYVYFFERGLHELKEGGRLGFIVANKWLRSGYAEPLRKMFARETEVETLVDFGHAPIFPDIDAFPCIIVVNKLAKGIAPRADHALEVTTFPRDELHKISIPEYVAQHRYPVPQARLTGEGWNLEPAEIDGLLAKIRSAGTPLARVAGKRPLYGLKTGRNDAFVVDGPTKDRLVRDDPASGPIFRRYLRGQDIARWAPRGADSWLILMKSSGDFAWPWSGLPDDAAEASFRATLPALHQHMKSKEAELRKRTDQGRYWWELRTCSYYDVFDGPKIVYPDIVWESPACFDDSGLVSNNTVYLLPSADPWLLAVMNSPVLWFWCFRNAVHGKDEALRFFTEFVETIPIAPATDAARAEAEIAVPRLVALAKANHQAQADLLLSLRVQYDVDKPGQKLEDFASLDERAFVDEIAVRRTRGKGKLRPATVRELTQLFNEEAAPVRARRAEALALERRLAALVNDAYGLTPEEVELMWTTAPPRMPVGR